MTHKECAIVRDLLPSYVEGLLSEESRGFVEAHLAECGDCAEVLAAMRAEMEGPEAEADPAEDAQVLQAMRKSYRSIRVRTIVLAVVLGVAVFAGVAGLWNFLQHYEVPISGTEADLFSIGDTPEGEVYWRYGSSGYTYNGWGYSPRMDEAENTLYLTLHRALLGRSKRPPEEAQAAAAEVDVLQNPDFAWELNAWASKDGRLYTESGWMPVAGPGGELLEGMGVADPERNAAVEIRKIYIGSPDDYRLAWQAGDELAKMIYNPKSYMVGLPAGARPYDTDLRVAAASEGRAIMEAGLADLGIDLPPYELTYPNWNGHHIERYETRAEGVPYSTYQHASGWDSILDSGTFFREVSDPEDETLRGLWALAIRSVYPEISDIEAAKLLRKLENTLEPDPHTDNVQLRGGTRLGEYAFGLVWDTEERKGGYLQISYLGRDWPERD